MVCWLSHSLNFHYIIGASHVGQGKTNRHIASQPFTQQSDMSLLPGFVEPSKYFEDTSWWISLKILNKSNMLFGNVYVGEVGLQLYFLIFNIRNKFDFA